MKGLPVANQERLLTSWSHGEDAALWEIDDERIGILTVDFITPVVDDPTSFGEIAAANALSDVFAMGGRPLVALNVVGFPTSCEPLSVLKDILNGGAQTVIEAGAVLAGGHSVQDKEPKYGLVVFGEVRKGRDWRVDGAHDGDMLILTKPLGTGIATTSIKAGLFPEEHIAAVVDCMATLNDPAKAGIKGDLHSAIHACTDVTGFGLAGHAADMLADGMGLTIRAESLPVLPGIREMAAMGMIPAGNYANRGHSGRFVVNDIADQGLRALTEDLLFDPQTSGGLLLAVDPDAADVLLERLKTVFPATALVGKFAGGARSIRVI